MTNTRIKLEEAKYFFTRMIEEVANREPFKYNLSAFLSAGRSVTFVMHSEFSNITGFSKWYEEKKKQMSDDNLMKFMIEKRNIALKQETISPRAYIEINLTSTVEMSDSLVTILTHKDGSVERIEYKQEPPPVPKPKEEQTEEVKYRWYFEDIPDKDILTLSQSYIERLESLVSECESRFISEQLNE